MTNKSYSGISDAELAPGQPITTSLMTRMRDDALAITQNDPIAAVFAGLAGNWVSRWDVITNPNSPPASESGTWEVPDGVHRLLVVVVGGGGCGSAAQDGSGNPLRGHGSPTTFSTAFADGGRGNNTFNGFSEYSGCFIGMRGAPADYYGVKGGSTLFSPGPDEDEAAPANAYGCGGGHTAGGGGAAAVGVAILNVNPGDLISYAVGNSFDPAFLVGGGYAGAPGLILIAY